MQCVLIFFLLYGLNYDISLQINVQSKLSYYLHASSKFLYNILIIFPL